MERREALQKSLIGIAQGILGFVCSLVCIMGYYPLVPAFFAANSLLQENSFFLYIGIVLGMGYFMPLSSIVKYVIALVVIAVAIRFYQWANYRCGGIAAAVIAGVVTIILNMSGRALGSMDRMQILLGISEGVLVFGATILLYFAIEWILALRIFKQVPGRDEEDLEPEIGAISESKERISAFATAVDGLSNAFTMMNRAKEPGGMESVGILEQEITGKLCASCEGCAVCWNENWNHLVGKIRRMLNAVVEHRPKEEIVSKEYVTECHCYPDMVEEAILAFSRMELNQAWYKRLLENRLVIASQLDAMSDLMQDWAKGDRLLDSGCRMQLVKIAFEVKERGLIAEDVHIYENLDNRRYIRAKVYSKWGGGIPSRNYRKALEKAMGMKLRLDKDARSVLTKEPVYLTAYEDTRYYVMTGVATKKKNGSTVSGDNFSMFGMDNGRHYICLSDGMGSGSRASQESELVVDLLQKFIEAGFQKETAIRMMNSAMVLQGEDNAYSTLDVADINLYTGEVELTKIGAAATFIKKKEEVESICSTSLPAGAVVDPETEQTTCALSSGDFLVMVTDGVLEYLHVKNPVEKLSEIIRELEMDNAGAMAKELLDRVLMLTGGYAMDDMTVLVLGIWEK